MQQKVWGVKPMPGISRRRWCGNAEARGCNSRNGNGHPLYRDEPTGIGMTVTAKENVPGAVSVLDSVPAEEKRQARRQCTVYRAVRGTGEPFAAKV